MRAVHFRSLRPALAFAVAEAIRTGSNRQIGHCGDPFGWSGYAVIEHEGSTYPGLSAPSSWCHVAEVSREGLVSSCGHFLNWATEYNRAFNTAMCKAEASAWARTASPEHFAAVAARMSES
jgi:hypothetical protein